MNEGIDRPDSNESPTQRERYNAAQTGFDGHRARVETALNRFDYTRAQFNQIEQEFLDLVDELRKTDKDQVHNLAHLEGLRLRLLTSLDGDYKHSMNELADSMLESIGMARLDSDGRFPAWDGEAKDERP